MLYLETGSIAGRCIQDIIRMNLLTKFHEDRTVNVASRVLTRFNNSHIRKNARPWWPCFKGKKNIFELIQDIIGTNHLTKFHDDRKINVTSIVLKRKNTLPLWWPYIIRMNLLTEFHEDRTINVASTENAPPLGSQFHEDGKINVASIDHIKTMPRPLAVIFFIQLASIFKLIQDIIGNNLLTKLHEDWTIYFASRVLTRFYYSHNRKNAQPLGSHVFQAKISMRPILTKFNEDWTINEAYRMLTRQMLTPHDGRLTTHKRRSQKLTMSTLCSSELTKNVIKAESVVPD
ncbi:hypothetical protein DPMN_187983 [Dreissena polymorpha]|uniref:Uncharacterized protein n=1 Tax=Dreissena polymorpha TaxID=45954 RepID=A0A9D4DQT6_DREPO|nr:hypothetical protein DPMN_187983 [Dreissena polymorpha]